jgi:outer membrane receptor protein involved in Fe transport
MQRSRKPATRRTPSRLPLSVAICFAIAASAQAQEAAPPPADPAAPTLDAIEVTAQKRTENLQKVPISMQVLGEQQLEQLVVSDFEDYVKFLPTVSYQTFGPGFAQIYMRGVASGGDGNHSGSLPSVGVYLDEQPVTTIQGPLDIHIYDVARVESLAGPQGTLYGRGTYDGDNRGILINPSQNRLATAGYLQDSRVQRGASASVNDRMSTRRNSRPPAFARLRWKGGPSATSR